MLNYYRANYPRDTGDAVNPSAAAAAAPAKIKAPVLVIHGVKDTALNARGHNSTWEQVEQDTTILMLPSAGHFVQADAPALVNGTIHDWLNRRPVAR
jgi:pimeloyl-ACP methyl ester carboxylesterase